MNQSIAAVLCILVLIAETRGQGLQLSDTYAYESTGTQIVTVGSAVTTTLLTRNDQAEDASKGLTATNKESITNGATRTIDILTSLNDTMRYTANDGVCSVSIYDAASFGNPLSNTFDGAVENSPGTYSVTKNNFVFTLVTVDGIPTSFTTNLTSTAISSITVVTYSSYINGSAPFSRFELPTGCSEFNCTFCYLLLSSAAPIANTMLLLLITLVATVMLA